MNAKAELPALGERQAAGAADSPFNGGASRLPCLYAAFFVMLRSHRSLMQSRGIGLLPSGRIFRYQLGHAEVNSFRYQKEANWTTARERGAGVGSHTASRDRANRRLDR